MKERQNNFENRVDLCGPMALMIAYRAHNHDRTIQELIDELDVRDGGVNWYQMFNHAIKEGFSVTFKNKARYSELIKIAMLKSCLTAILLTLLKRIK